MKILLVIFLFIVSLSTLARAVGSTCEYTEDCDEGSMCVESDPSVWTCWSPDKSSISKENFSGGRNLVSIDCNDSEGNSHQGVFNISHDNDLIGMSELYKFIKVNCDRSRSF